MEGKTLNVLGKWPTAVASALGATPVSLSGKECYAALDKGLLDGVITNPLGLVIHKNQDVLNYTTVANLFIHVFVVTMNLDTWNSLPPDLQALFEGENAWRLAEVFGYQFDKDELAAQKIVEEAYAERGKPGLYFLPADEMDRWERAIIPVREMWLEESSASGAPTMAILQDVMAAAQKYSYENHDSSQCADILHDWGAEGY